MTEEEKLIVEFMKYSYALKEAGLEPNIQIACYPSQDKCFMRGFLYTMGGVTAMAVVLVISKFSEWVL